MGHDTEHCFVLKHLVQDCIDKSILVEDEDEGKMEILSAPFPKAFNINHLRILFPSTESYTIRALVKS